MKNTNKRANTTMARTATMRVESNSNPAANLVARFNNVLKHFLKIDPEGENLQFLALLL